MRENIQRVALSHTRPNNGAQATNHRKRRPQKSPWWHTGRGDVLPTMISCTPTYDVAINRLCPIVQSADPSTIVEWRGSA